MLPTPIYNWKDVAAGAWSMKLIYLSTAIGVAQTGMSALAQVAPDPRIVAISTLVTAFAGVVRLLAQPKL